MSIYGTGYSKFKGADSGVHSLNHSLLKPEWQIPQVIKHTSILTGKVNFIKISSDKSRFTVIVNLWKAGSVAQQQTALDLLLVHNHTLVKFMPHRTLDTYIFETDGQTEADFYITTMKPFYLKNSPPLLKDRLLIVFESISPTLLPLVSVGFLVDEGGDYLIDEGGGKLIQEL